MTTTIDRPVPFRLLSRFYTAPWAIEPDALKIIHQILTRSNDLPSAISEQLGAPLANTRRVEMRGSIAVIPITGPIIPRADLFLEISGAVSLSSLALDLRQAIDNPDVSASVLEIDSPGGVAFGVDEFARMVREGDAEKPIHAFVSGMAASAAYWIASAARSIVAEKVSLLGSIGVVLAVHKQVEPNSRGEMEFEIVSSSAPKKRPDPESEEGRATLLKLVDDFEVEFISAVAKYRGVAEETVRSDFGQGGVEISRNAVTLGMADRIATFEGFLAELADGENEENASASAGSHVLASEDDMKIEDLTAEALAADRPDLVTAIQAAAVEKQPSAESIATAERDRVVGVLEAGKASPGSDALVAEMVDDGKTTPTEAKARLFDLAATRGSDALAANAADANSAVDEDPEDDGPDLPSPEAGSGHPVEPGAKAKAAWENDEKLQAEFGSADEYAAWQKYAAKHGNGERPSAVR